MWKSLWITGRLSGVRRGVACGGVVGVSVSAMWRRGTLRVAAIVVANALSCSFLEVEELLLDSYKDKSHKFLWKVVMDG
jgi:hypothetical protein